MWSSLALDGGGGGEEGKGVVSFPWLQLKKYFQTKKLFFFVGRKKAFSHTKTDLEKT